MAIVIAFAAIVVILTAIATTCWLAFTYWHYAQVPVYVLLALFVIYLIGWVANEF